MRNLKTEVNVLKNFIKSLTLIMQEGKVLNRLVEGLKEEKKNTRRENKQIVKRSKHVEEEFGD